MKTNYSSARQAGIEDDLTFAEEVEPLQENFMDEVFESFVISCVLSGELKIRDFWEHKSDYLLHTSVASPKRWIDPLKEANANRIAMESSKRHSHRSQPRTAATGRVGSTRWPKYRLMQPKKAYRLEV